MQTVAIISQKGGSGKTTLALHLAVASQAAGRDTAIIDLDPQASAAKWSDRRANEVPVVISAHAARLPNEIERVRQAGCDFLLIDTAPHSDAAALEAIKHADLVLIPCRPAILDMEAISNTLNLVRAESTPVYVIMNAVAPQGSEAAEAAEAIAGLGAPVCPVQLVSRVAFSRSLINGLAAQEIKPDGKAALAVAELHRFMCAHLNGLTKKPKGETTHAKQVRKRT